MRRQLTALAHHSTVFMWWCLRSPFCVLRLFQRFYYPSVVGLGNKDFALANDWLVQLTTLECRGNPHEIKGRRCQCQGTLLSGTEEPNSCKKVVVVVNVNYKRQAACESNGASVTALVSRPVWIQPPCLMQLYLGLGRSKSRMDAWSTYACSDDRFSPNQAWQF